MVIILKVMITGRYSYASPKPFHSIRTLWCCIYSCL